MKYRSDIDGLRAVAVLSVLAFHAFPSMMSGGFIGVDVFFVISGFLISTILFTHLEKGTFSFADFYSRRIRRIFPSLLLLLIACFGLGWYPLIAEEYKQLGKHIAAGAGFVSNIALWKESGYFDNSAETKPLLHLWSLGIEEQFYIVWPVLLWAAWKRKFNLLWIAVAVAALSFYLNFVGISKDPVATFYAPQTRFWELLSGSILAWTLLHKKQLLADLKLQTKLKNCFSIAGILLLSWGLFRFDKTLSFPGVLALLPVIAAVLIISAGDKAFLNRTLLSNRLVVWFGLISFPLYLWHWPLLSFARIIEGETPDWKIRLGAVILSIGLAWATFELVEKPLRFGGYTRLKVASLVSVMVVIGCLGNMTYNKSGLVFRNNSIERNLAEQKYKDRFYKNDFATSSYPSFKGYYSFKTKDEKPAIMILGDSHANRLLMGLSEKVDETLLQLSHHGCPEFSDLAVSQTPTGEDDCYDFTQDALKVAENTESIKQIVINFRGPTYLSDSRERFIRLKHSPSVTSPREILNLAIRETFNRLLQKGKHLIFVFDNPEIPFDPIQCADVRPFHLSHKTPSTVCQFSRADFEKQQAEYRSLMKEILKDYPKVQVLDLADLFCDNDKCSAIKDGKILYDDKNHLSLSGSRLVAEQLSQLLTHNNSGT